MSVVEVPRIEAATFEQLVAEASARINVHTPDWSNHNDADPGITILQLFAFIAESVLYRANQVPDRNRRIFLHLLGHELRPATSARGIVTFDGTKGPVTARLLLEDTEVLAGAIPFLTTATIDVLPVTALPCVKQPSATPLDESESAHFLSQFSDLVGGATTATYYETRRLELPAGGATYNSVDLAQSLDRSLWIALLAPRADLVTAVRETIAGKSLSLGALPDIADAARELAPRSTRRAEDPPQLQYAIPVAGPLGEVRRPRYTQLQAIEHDDILVEPGTVTLTLPAKEALGLWADLEPAEDGMGDFPPLLEEAEAARVVTWLRIRRAEAAAAEEGEALSARFAWVGANAVTVLQHAGVPDERLADGDGTPGQRRTLASTPVLTDTVTLTVDGVRWQRTDDLRTAPPEVAAGRRLAGTAVVGPAEVFAVEPDGTVSFGSGHHGARPHRGAVIRASYEYGGGRGGLVPAGAVSAGPTLPPGVTVTNPVPTWGGADAETLDEAEARFAELVHNKDRLVTGSDMEEIVERTPGVDLGRAEILPLLHPELVGVESPGVVTVLVIPRSDPGQPDAPRPDRMFLDGVCGYLDERRLVTTELHVRGPDYVPINVAVGFESEPGASVAAVRTAVTTAIRGMLAPLPSGPWPGWPLGKAVDERELFTEVARVDGVSVVLGVRLARVDGTEQDTIPIAGLQLPRLVGLSVQPGDPADPTALDGGAPTAPSVLPVPFVPDEC